jgi:hypothetical protein
MSKIYLINGLAHRAHQDSYGLHTYYNMACSHIMLWYSLAHRDDAYGLSEYFVDYVIDPKDERDTVTCLRCIASERA